MEALRQLPHENPFKDRGAKSNINIWNEVSVQHLFCNQSIHLLEFQISQALWYLRQSSLKFLYTVCCDNGKSYWTRERGVLDFSFYELLRPFGMLKKGNIGLFYCLFLKELNKEIKEYRDKILKKLWSQSR